jgi:hypothetical protein
MAYIGKSPIIGNFVKLDAITAVNGQAAYTMQNGGSNFTDYESVNQFLVSLNGTIQAPTSSFTVSGSTLTFASNLATGDVIDFIMVFGNSLSAGTPTDATVSTAKIVDDAVTAAKINNDIISGSTELASEPADTDEFLVSDAGTLKRIDYSLIKGGGITVADQWRITSNFSISSSSTTFATSNLEQVDTSGQGTLGSAMTESSGVFTFPQTGIYLVESIAQFYVADDARWIQNEIYVTTNNSSYTHVAGNYGFTQITQSSNTYIAVPTSTYVDVTDTSNVKVKFGFSRVDPNSVNVAGDSSINQTHFNFIRLGDT